MQTPLTPQETALVWEMLTLQHESALQEELAAFAADPTRQVSAPTRRALLDNARLLVRHGLHEMALAGYEDLIVGAQDRDTAIEVAMAAWLSGTHDLAWMWVDRAMSWPMRGPTQFEPFEDYIRMDWLADWKLTKLLQDMGRMVEMRHLRPRLIAVLQGQAHHATTLLHMLAFAVALGYREEAALILQALPPIYLPMMSGDFVDHVIRVCFAQGEPHLVWALIAMSAETHDSVLFVYAAVEAAVSMRRYDWALRFAAYRLSDPDASCGLEQLGKCLVLQGKMSDWPAIWTHVQRGSQSDFPVTDILRLLAAVAEQCDAAQAAELLAYTRKCAEQAQGQPEQAQVLGLCFVVEAWLGEEAQVQALLPAVEWPSHAPRLVMRAGFLRGFEWLAQVAFSQLAPGSTPHRLTAIQLESWRRKAGQPDQMRPMFEALREAAFRTGDAELISQLATLAILNLKDVALYFDLKAECEEKQIRFRGSGDIALRMAARSGDLVSLANRIRQAGVWRQDEHLLSVYLESCLAARSDFSKRMGVFGMYW